MRQETAPYVHPLHEKMREEWLFWRRAYDGGREYLENYLSRHENELAPYFAKRIERAVYPNIVRNVVDTYTAHVFHEAVVREDTAGLGEWHDDVDLQGTPADEFYAHVLCQAQIYGSCGVLSDRYEPNADVAPVTRAQERELGRRPYMVALTPPDIIDWQTDRFGALMWLIHRDEDVSDRAPLERPGAPEPRFKLWTPSSWATLEVQVINEGSRDERRDFRIIDEGGHPCRRVPIQFMYWGKRKSPQILGQSAISDIAPMGRRIANLTSLIDEQAFQHVFNVMVVPAATYAALKKQNFSTGGCLTYDAAEGKPYYLAPDVNQLTVLRDELRETMMEARVLSGLGRQNEDSRAAVSGRSMAFQTMDKVALLKLVADRMAALEYEVDANMLVWMESNAEPTPAQYDTDFDPEAISAQLEEALMFESFGIGGKARAATMKAIARSYLGPKLEADELADVLDDIEQRFAPVEQELGEDGSPLGGEITGGGDKAADTALNGIQVRSLLEIGMQVARGELDREAGVILIVQAFGWEQEVAATYIDAAAKSEPDDLPDPNEFASTPPAAQPQPATAPPPEN